MDIFAHIWKLNILMWNCRNEEISEQYTAISIKVVPEQSKKVEYERERLAANH
jgi:hypothetical protein